MKSEPKSLNVMVKRIAIPAMNGQKAKTEEIPSLISSVARGIRPCSVGEWCPLA